MRYALHVQPFTFHDVWLSPLFHTLETAPQKQHYHQHYQECTTCSQAQIVIVIIHHRFPWFLCFSFTFHYVWLFLGWTCDRSYRNPYLHSTMLDYFLIEIRLDFSTPSIYIPLCLIIPRNIHNLFLLIIFIYIPLCLIISYSDSPLTLSDTYLHSTMSDYFRNTIAYHRRDIFIYIPLCLIITICIVSGLISVYIFTFHYVWLFLTGFFAI